MALVQGLLFAVKILNFQGEDQVFMGFGHGKIFVSIPKEKKERWLFHTVILGTSFQK